VHIKNAGINNILGNFAILKLFSKIRPFSIYIRKYTTHKPLKVLWIQGFMLLLPLFLGANTSSYAQSIKIDSTALSVDTILMDTLIQGKGGLEDVVDYEARDSIILDLENKMAHLYGDAHVLYTDIDLKADYIRINFETKELFATSTKDSNNMPIGIPHFKQAENEFDIDTLTYNFGTKRAKLSGLRLVEGESYIICNTVFRNEDGSIITDIGKYTTCNLENPHFYFKARKLKIIPNDKIVFGPANLVVENVPTPLFLPFGLFPVKKNKESGLILPAPEMGGFRGFGLTALGYHFQLSDYYNLTLSTDLYFGGSYRLNTLSKYAKRYKYNGQIDLAYAYNIISGSKEEFNLVSSKDYSINWVHSENPKNHPGRTFSANVQYNGGRYNQNFTRNTENFGNNQFTSTLNYSKVLIKNRLNLNLNARASQNTLAKSLDVVAPSANLTMQRLMPFKSKKDGVKRFYDKLGLSYTGAFTNPIVRNDSDIFNLETWRKPWKDANRTVRHTVPVDMPFSVYNNYFTITPFFSYNEEWFFKLYNFDYNKSEKKYDTTISTINGIGRMYDYSTGANITTNIFGTYNFKSKNLKALRHVITPQVGFFYKPDFTREFYGFAKRVTDTLKTYVYNKYNGSSFLPGRKGTISFNIGNNITGKKVLDDSVKTVKKFSIIDQLSVNSGYNILADSQNWSDIGVSLATILYKSINITSRASFSPYYITEKGFKTNTLTIKNGGGLGQLSSFNVSVSAQLNPSVGKQREKDLEDIPDENRYMYDVLRRQLLDFSLPWSLAVNASANHFPFAQNGTKWTLVPAFNGDVSISPMWKVTFNSGYDLFNKKISETTAIGVARSLHCWTLKFDWNPVGTRKNFTFVFQPTATMIQDLKVTKRNYWWNEI